MSRPKQTEIEMEGKGVAPVKDRKLNVLCDEFLDDLDKRSKISERMTGTEVKILDRMGELGVTVHRFRDQIAKINPGKPHIKIRTVKDEPPVESDEAEEKE